MGVNDRECILTFGGISSSDIGVTVESYPGVIKPDRNVDTETIPGRNGVLLYDYGTYKNYTQEYYCHWRKNREWFDNEDVSKTTNVSADYRIIPWLRLTGYQRLEDSFHPMHYRMAYIEKRFEVENLMNQLGRAELRFECKPQWFRKDGETAITISSSGYTLNNTGMDSLPIMTVNGSGDCSVSVNGYRVNISSVPSGGIVLDSELQDAYSPDKLTNLNSLVTITNDKFPVLTYGENSIVWTGNVTSVTIKPRWWDLL